MKLLIQSMVNLYQLAKMKLKTKSMGKNSKLDHSDIRDLIIIAMVDGVLTSQEIEELKEIERYSIWNMTDKASNLYNKFMAGCTGKKGHKSDKHVNIVAKAEKMLDRKSKNNQEHVFDVDDVKELLLLSIKDGMLTAAKVNQLIRVKDILDNRITQEGLDLFLTFGKAYHKRLYPSNPKQQQTTHSHQQVDNNNNLKTQCGYCFGNGTVTCSSCFGMGGRNESRAEYAYDGDINYRTEFVNCYACNGGYSRCSSCGGTGQVYV